MKLSEEQAIFTLNVAKLIVYINQKGNRCTFGETYRPKETAEIYAKEGIGIKNSLHTDRLAVDLNLFTASGVYITDGACYEPFGTFWKNLHPLNKFGGDFKVPSNSDKTGIASDFCHFQMDKG